MTLDCDGTLTKQEVGSLFRVVEQTVLPPKLLEEIDNLRTYFKPKWDGKTITSEEELFWLRKSVELFKKAGLTEERIGSIFHAVKVRPGLREALVRLKQAGIPVSIISCTIAQFIEAMLCHNGLREYVDQIYASRLVLKNGRILGLKEDSIVRPRHKGVFSLEFSQRHQVPRQRLLAVGDSPATDELLGYRLENRLGIADSQEELEKLAASQVFGKAILLPNGHFAPAERWIFQRIRQL